MDVPRPTVRLLAAVRRGVAAGSVRRAAPLARFGSVLVLAAAAVPALALDPAVRDRATSRDAAERVAAAEPLARDGSSEAARYLVRLLSDDAPEVRDTAIEACAALTSVEGADVLANAIGRGSATVKCATIAGAARTRRRSVLAALAKTLQSEGDAAVRAEAAEALRWFPSEKDAAAACASAAKDRDPQVRAAAVFAASCLKADAGRTTVVAGFADPDAGVRTAALAAMRGDDAADHLDVAAADPDWRVRAECVDAALRLRSAAGIDALVRLVGDANARVGGAACRALRRLSGKVYARDADLWRAWWAQNRAAWQVPPFAGDDPRAADGPGTRARFMGIEVEGEGTAFVLDFSGSMEAPMRGRETRADVVRDELTVTLAALADGHRVNVVAFSDKVRPFAEAARALQARTRGAVASFARSQVPAGETNLLGGLLAALADPSVDTVFLLSDGAPTVGDAVSPDRVRTLVARANRTRKVAVHAIGIGVETDGERRFLRELAAQNGGSSVFR